MHIAIYKYYYWMDALFIMIIIASVESCVKWFENHLHLLDYGDMGVAGTQFQVIQGIIDKDSPTPCQRFMRLKNGHIIL